MESKDNGAAEDPAETVLEVTPSDAVTATSAVTNAQPSKRRKGHMSSPSLHHVELNLGGTETTVPPEDNFVDVKLLLLAVGGLFNGDLMLSNQWIGPDMLFACRLLNVPHSCMRTHVFSTTPPVPEDGWQGVSVIFVLEDPWTPPSWREHLVDSGFTEDDPLYPMPQPLRDLYPESADCPEVTDDMVQYETRRLLVVDGNSRVDGVTRSIAEGLQDPQFKYPLVCVLDVHPSERERILEFYVDINQL
jgi:hypothetical protein